MRSVTIMLAAVLIGFALAVVDTVRADTVPVKIFPADCTAASCTSAVA